VSRITAASPADKDGAGNNEYEEYEEYEKKYEQSDGTRHGST
jgi:hypothetical protein